MQAADGEATLVAVRQHRPDFVLLDIMMPKLHGGEVTRRLKSDPTQPFIPVILVTAKGDSKDIVAGLEAGTDEYLTKPVDQVALVARVKCCASRRSMIGRRSRRRSLWPGISPSSGGSPSRSARSNASAD